MPLPISSLDEKGGERIIRTCKVYKVKLKRQLQEVDASEKSESGQATNGNQSSSFSKQPEVIKTQEDKNWYTKSH